MLAGSLTALETASIVAWLPIAVLLLLMAYGMAKSLHEDFPVEDVEDTRELEYLNRWSVATRQRTKANWAGEIRPSSFVGSLPLRRISPHSVRQPGG